MEDTVLLQMSRLAKIHGSQLLFKNLDLSIRKGNTALLTGDNGTGKSTLLRIAAGLCRPTAGTVSTKPGLRLAFLGHATFIYPGLTALENLTFWHRASSPKASRDLEKALDAVGLLAHAHLRAGKFSRGMAQRLNFARLLVTDPELFLLDEPFTGLDSNSRQTIIGLLQERRKTGAAMLIVSHDPSTDSVLANTVYHLAKKRLEIVTDQQQKAPANRVGASC